MTTSNETLFQLLRLALGVTHEAPGPLTAAEWQKVYKSASRQSVVGLVYSAVSHLPRESRPPFEMLVQWAGKTEAIRGMNTRQNEESARLTRLFEAEGRKTSILKGQANARLYPDPGCRQAGDIDIWIEGGRDGVIDLLLKTGLIDERPDSNPVGDKGWIVYHHIDLPKKSNGVEVEVHFRPSQGNENPFSNRRMQRWLEQEILLSAPVPEGFNVPSAKFALIMQLSHIQHHLFTEGVGLRQLCDYFLLLKAATSEERQEVSGLLKKFGLHRTGGAVMWLLQEVLGLEKSLMICAPDSKRGKWMLTEVMEGGNFGSFAERQQYGTLKRELKRKQRQLALFRFDPTEIIWLLLNFAGRFIKSIPFRIKYGRVALKG